MDSTRTKADVQAELDALHEQGKDRRTKEVRDLEAELEAISAPKSAPTSGGHFAPDLKPKGSGKATKYWLGVLPGAPVQNVTIGAVCFPLFTGRNLVIDAKNRKRRISRGEISADDRGPHTYVSSGHTKGEVIELLPEQVEEIKSNLPRKAVAWRDAQRTNGYVFNADSPRVRLHGNEEPLSRFVFMVKQEYATDVWPDPIESLGIEDPDN